MMGQRNCPKHVEFYSKNKFEKFVYLVGFIIRIYHDARSPEGQISKYCQLLGLLNPFWNINICTFRVLSSQNVASFVYAV